MSISRTLEAARWATIWHADQERKYTGEPYMVHPLNVAKLVNSFSYQLKPSDEDLSNMIAAALLHDVLEDTTVSQQELRTRFGDSVADMVTGLTDHFTKEEYPDMNREARKKAERVLLAAQPVEVQFIKACDLLDNLDDIIKHSPSFAKVYVPECAATVAVLTKLPIYLRAYVEGKINKSMEQLS